MKTYLVIPTYNEAGNIEALLKEIRAQNIPDLTPVVVDDNSPDGTAKLAEKDAKVILRTKDRGRGSAGIEGFKYALKEGADYIIEMDADFSHHPKYLKDLIKPMDKYDIVLGSRFVEGGKDLDRGIARKVVTTFARNYIKWMLGIKINDITSGYRCFRRKVLEAIDLDHMISTGPSIVSEILYKASLKGFKIYEAPIIFEDRKTGETKLNFKILLKTLYMIYKFRKAWPDAKSVGSKKEKEPTISLSGQTK
ncbi:MAG: polyprenol monophosphomannose synthase [Candidatus Margulisiibacteriota bacterium]|nr:polyprenol monophosphomannose synthase [Candidatus Margulisiibacteriota bacterium]